MSVDDEHDREHQDRHREGVGETPTGAATSAHSGAAAHHDGSSTAVTPTASHRCSTMPDGRRSQPACVRQIG